MPERDSRRWPWVLLASVVGVAVLVVAAVFVSRALLHWGERRDPPEFPSLGEEPDPGLEGTVAYYDDASRCVRLVAAAGTPSKELYCLPADTWENAPTRGKPAGPQLVWRPDGRLEITLFRMKAPSGAFELTPDWQRIVDPRTGAVEDAPAADLPADPEPTGGPQVSPDGRQVDWTFDAMSGKGEVTLTEAGRTRTLLSVHGPGEYTYGFGPVFWEPGGRWLVATDSGRILVITPDDPSETRVLVTGTGEGAGGGTAGPFFAVTDERILG